LQGVPQLRRVWQIPASDGDAWTGEPILAGGEPHPAGGTAFAQVNAEVARELVGHVVAVSGTPGVDAGADRAVDAYGGTGEFARALSARGWSVTAIESDAGAVGMARDGLDDAEVMDVVHALVEDALPGRLPAALLVVNPPRSGLSEAVRGCILDAPPTRLVYVSCDPATLARDVRALSGCFELDGLRCFDLFPQTAHVETVAVFTRSQPEFAA
jgi:23S rRNA (uracil1939-C5)-methyltransferase